MAHAKQVKKIAAHKAQISCLKYLQTTDMFVSCGWDNMINICKIEYDLDKFGKYVSNLSGRYTLDNGAAVLSVNSCQIDSTFLLAGSENRITVWNLATGARENELHTNTSPQEIVLVENKFA